MTWAPDYSTSVAVKSYLRIDDTADDAFIAQWVTAVSRNVDQATGRQFGSVPAELRTYPGVWDRSLGAAVFEIDDTFDVSGLIVATDDTVPIVVAAADYTLWPRNAPQKGKPYTQLRTSRGCADLNLTTPWGWSAVPASIPTALHIQAARLAARRDSPFGVAGSPTEGSEIRLLAQLDPDFRTTLKPYVRKWWAA